MHKTLKTLPLTDTSYFPDLPSGNPEITIYLSTEWGKKTFTELNVGVQSIRDGMCFTTHLTPRLRYPLIARITAKTGELDKSEIIKASARKAIEFHQNDEHPLVKALETLL